MVPAFRRMPGCGARCREEVSVANLYHLDTTHHSKSIGHVIHSLLGLTLIFKNGLFANGQIHAVFVETAIVSLATALCFRNEMQLKRTQLPLAEHE